MAQGGGGGKETPREVFGRIVQCRTGHGFIGEYYYEFVPMKNTDCPCGERLQTREHIIRTCPTYEPYRHILRKVSKDIALPDILGNPDGIEALTEYISKSGAFTVTGRRRGERQEYEPYNWFTHWTAETGDEWERMEGEEPSWTGKWREGEEAETGEEE
ncbi:hypothetical protein PQX77_020854 [Marasmius sp. AFHP31]|nr:hypothetical protein PQX77_020854 [Marasmius sp. AFHP31]